MRKEKLDSIGLMIPRVWFFCCFFLFLFLFSFFPPRFKSYSSSAISDCLSNSFFPHILEVLRTLCFGYCVNTLHYYPYLMAFLLLSEATLSSVENVCSESIVLGSNHGSLAYCTMTLGDLSFPHFCLTLGVVEFELLSPKLQ